MNVYYALCKVVILLRYREHKHVACSNVRNDYFKAHCTKFIDIFLQLWVFFFKKSLR